MARRYYSARTKPGNLTLGELHWKFQNLYLYFRDKDYFKGKAGITETYLPNVINHEVAIALTFQPFPVTKWEEEDITEDHIFDVLEFLYDKISKPEDYGSKTSDSGLNYYDYGNYDDNAGQEEFRNNANVFLADYKTGFELNKEGMVLALGEDGLQHITEAEIIPYDEKNVDSKVRNAILKWRNRRLAMSEKREAIRELADVFEWLKKTKNLSSVFDSKDESLLFDLANNFGIRHHNPKQKTNYDPSIWYSWMFHFYLATYHAAIRLLMKDKNTVRRKSR